MAKKVISFASDFGIQDGSVGVVKGVISRIDQDILVTIFLTKFHHKI
jgi:S-adenosylmethionine hydrolase